MGLDQFGREYRVLHLRGFPQGGPIGRLFMRLRRAGKGAARREQFDSCFADEKKRPGSGPGRRRALSM
jgi:hypothetical protein